MAVTLSFASSNIFLSGVLTTPYSAPNAQWAISFNVEDPPVPLVPTAMGFDVDFTDFSYTLDGNFVGVTPQAIRFFSTDVGGMFDIDFIAAGSPDLDPVTGLALTGPVLYSGPIDSPTLTIGSFLAGSGVFWYESSAIQPLGGTSWTVSDPVAAPEPGTADEIGLSLVVLLGFLAPRRFRRS